MNRNRFPYPKLTVLISTPNIDQMAAFYTAQLGLRPVPGAPDGIVALSRGATEIALMEGEGGGSAISLSLLVDDLDAWRGAVTDTALVHDVQDGRMGMPTFAIQDPDGNHITVSAPRRRQKETPSPVHLLASRAIRVHPNADEMAGAYLRLTEDRIGALQIDTHATPPTLHTSEHVFSSNLVPAPDDSTETHWLRMGRLYSALQFAHGDDLLITCREDGWHVRRITPAQRDESAIADANNIAVEAVMKAVHADDAPVALRSAARTVFVRRGWGGSPPDELSRIIEQDERLHLTPLNGVVLGPGADGSAAWNRARLQSGMDVLGSSTSGDVEAALSILGMKGAAAEGIRTMQRLASGRAEGQAEALTAEILQALLGRTDPS